MVTNVTLNLENRSASGKGDARRLRMAGKVPCVLYGRGADTLNLAVDNRELLQAVAGHSVSNLILDLNLTGDAAKALIRDIQLDPITHDVMHVDFQRISLTEKIELEIPLELVGMPHGVRDGGGILAHPVRSIAVKCFAGDIPDKITIDVSELGVGDSLHVSDLRDQSSVEIVSDADMLIASVGAPSVQLEAEPAEAVEGEAAEGEGAEGEAAGEGDGEGEGEGGGEEDKK